MAFFCESSLFLAMLSDGNCSLPNDSSGLWDNYCVNAYIKLQKKNSSKSVSINELYLAFDQYGLWKYYAALGHWREYRIKY